MKDVVHIIGHKNPDTDSIVSAIAYAQLKSDMTNILMSDKGEKPISLMKNTSCENIRKVLQGEFLYECDAYRTNGRIHILCSRNAEYSDISYRDSIVVVNDDLKLQKRALSDGAGCMILVDVDIPGNYTHGEGSKLYDYQNTAEYVSGSPQHVSLTKCEADYEA